MDDAQGGVRFDAGVGGEGTGREEPGDAGPPRGPCEAPGNLMPCDAQTDDPFAALGLGCGGAPNETIPIEDATFASTDPAAWRIASQYGTYLDPGSSLPVWHPREGSSMLVLSTGALSTPDASGVLAQVSDALAGSGFGLGVANSNPDGVPLPVPIRPARGSNGGIGGTPFVGCDGVNDCSDSIGDQWSVGDGLTHDLLWFQFTVPVPGGTYGFSFDFAYFSTEFPGFVGDVFNDMFLAWSASESYTGNLCFVNGSPCTVTALWPTAYAPHDPVMDGTQFSAGAGAATGWFRAKGAAVPHERLQLTFALFDMGDSIYDTVVLLDNFRWACEGCAPSEADPCVGIDPL